MKTRKITTAFAASVAALLFGTVAAFAAEPRVWTNSRGEIALRGTLDVERTLDETPGVEAPNRVYFIDASGAPIPKIAAQVQRIKRPSPTHWWRSESGEGVYTIDLTPGEYEARATAWRGNETVIYEGTTFIVPERGNAPVALTLNMGKTKNAADFKLVESTSTAAETSAEDEERAPSN